MPNSILITGADGYLGRLLTEKFLADTDAPLILGLRSKSEDEFSAKKTRLLECWGKFQPRIRFIESNLQNDKIFESLHPKEIEVIIHTAAITRFNVEESDASEVNAQGAQRVFQWATRCSNLKSFAYTSTLYSTGLRSGVIDERPIDDSAGFGNYYEQSKWVAENKLVSEFTDLPYQVFRISTVMADDATGHVTQFNAFHNTMKLIYYGLISIVPGSVNTPLYFVTGQAVVEAMFSAIQNSDRRKIYNIAPSFDETLTLGKLMDLTYEIFQQTADFKARRLLKPLLVDQKAFELLSKGTKGLSGDIVTQAMQSISPFAQQLFLQKEVENSELRRAWPGYSSLMPSSVDLARRTIQYLVDTRWGRIERSEVKQNVG